MLATLRKIRRTSYIQSLSTKLDCVDSRCQEKLKQAEKKINWSLVKENSSGCRER